MLHSRDLKPGEYRVVTQSPNGIFSNLPKSGFWWQEEKVTHSPENHEKDYLFTIQANEGQS